MSSSRKRRTRMVLALAVALLLAGGLVWTSFGASAQSVSPSALAAAHASGAAYQLTGTVMPGYRRAGGALIFRVRDRSGPGSVAVRYRGEVPDPFRAGREVIVTVRRSGTGWVGERDSLITKCPSKFKAA